MPAKLNARSHNLSFDVVSVFPPPRLPQNEMLFHHDSSELFALSSELLHCHCLGYSASPLAHSSRLARSGETRVRSPHTQASTAWSEWCNLNRQLIRCGISVPTELETPALFPGANSNHPRRTCHLSSFLRKRRPHLGYEFTTQHRRHKDPRLLYVSRT